MQRTPEPFVTTISEGPVFKKHMKGLTENLIERLSSLPGIGRKTAQRLAYFILALPYEEAISIADAIREVKEKARFCRVCFNITDDELCSICKDGTREHDRICIVEEPSNILAIERSNSYRGVYHVLLGALSPIDVITPERLRLKELEERVKASEIKEIIIATNPNTKGEITAEYIKEMLNPFGVAITRIAYGLPMGGDIEYADEVTIGKALEGRRSLL
jgi:recombination protein RecR